MKSFSQVAVLLSLAVSSHAAAVKMPRSNAGSIVEAVRSFPGNIKDWPLGGDGTIGRIPEDDLLKLIEAGKFPQADLGKQFEEELAKDPESGIGRIPESVFEKHSDFGIPRPPIKPKDYGGSWPPDAKAGALGEIRGAYDCPAVNGTTYSPKGSTSTFKVLCNIDFASPQRVSPTTLEKVRDLESKVTLSLETCIDLCAAYNVEHGPYCKAVSYGAEITRALDSGSPGNCHLKTNRSIGLEDNSGQEVSAYMIS